jgi:hypothetical protein
VSIPDEVCKLIDQAATEAEAEADQYARLWSH